MDTTVILAQPRVSRLRAAFVYVENRGMVGHGLAWFGMPCRTLDPTFSIGRLFTAAPFCRTKSEPSISQKERTECEKVPYGHARSDPPDLGPAIVLNNNTLQSGAQLPIGFLTQIWPQYIAKTADFLVFPQNSHILIKFNQNKWLFASSFVM